jgi:hypothetical protein
MVQYNSSPQAITSKSTNLQRNSTIGHYLKSISFIGVFFVNFPDRVYTTEEVKNAKMLVDQGYKHELIVEGSPEFKNQVDQALELVKTAGYYDFLQSHIRKIMEIDGITQLRETEVAIWASKFAVQNPVDAASLFIQKAYQMKEYLEGKLYYGGNAEKRSVTKRIEFLEKLSNKTENKVVKEECEQLLERWRDSSLEFN